MLLNGGIILHICFICAAIRDYCYASQNPELRILQGEQVRGSFCPGSTARLKCVFPEDMVASAWYVNGSERPTEVRFLSEDYQGHSVESSIEGGYALVNISKKEPYRASYICAVFHIVSKCYASWCVTCPSLSTTQLESSDWRKRITTRGLNS